MSDIEAKIMQRTMATVADALKDCKTTGDALTVLASLLPEGDSERLFTEWLCANSTRIPEACAELGVEFSEGPGLVKRLRELVGPLL